jgi:hypothetical protein
MGRVRRKCLHKEFDFAVIEVHAKSNPYASPTVMLFHVPVHENQNAPPRAVIIEQWTYRRGHCLRTFGEHEHEFFAARALAKQVVATYRRHYLKKHGALPHPATLTAGVTYGRPKLK